MYCRQLDKHDKLASFRNKINSNCKYMLYISNLYYL